MQRKDEVWKSSELVETYLHGVRRAVPLASEQIDVMMRLVAAREEGVESFLDLGCGELEKDAGSAEMMFGDQHQVKSCATDPCRLGSEDTSVGAKCNPSKGKEVTRHNSLQSLSF